jgi:sugar-specific transcriptional regulator TrmB
MKKYVFNQNGYSLPRKNRKEDKMETILEKKAYLAKVFDADPNCKKPIKNSERLNKQASILQEMLANFGLLKNEIKIYLFLAQMGEKKAGEIAEAISLHRTETYKILRDLEKKGLVFSVFAKPLKFIAIPLDKALELLMEVQKSKTKLLEKEKANLLKLWESIPRLTTQQETKELFQMLEGEQQVLLKAEKMLEKTESKFQAFAPETYMAQLFYNDFTDKLSKKRKKIDLLLLTDNSLKSHYFKEQLNWSKENCQTVDASKHPDLPCFMISDDKEVLIAYHNSAVSSETSNKKKFRSVALWTNCNAFVSTLATLFSKMLDA